MKGKCIWIILSLVYATGACRQESDLRKDDTLPLTCYVNPYIGTDGHGHVFLGANVPFGLVQLGPNEHTRGWDWCSGYHYSDSVIIGFGHMHLSGTGIGELGDVALLPVIDDQQREALFCHDNEQARPGYYAVTLQQTGIDVELTTTARTGFHRYSYPQDVKTPRILVDLKQGIGWDTPTDFGLKMENDTVLSGYRYSTGWAKEQKVYFTLVFSHPVQTCTMAADSVTVLSFAPLAGQPLLVKVGLSAVSAENAYLNLKVENPGWDFDGVAVKADKCWNEELNKIQIKTSDETARYIFYTALYHTMIAPSLFGDVNGEYRGADGQIHQDTTFEPYTTWSLWDTYRAAQPLSTLIHPEKQADFASTFLSIFQQQGKLPVWHLMGNETDCMVGNPCIPVLADIILKGFDVDSEEAFLAMKQSSLLGERSLDLLKEYGYIPYDKEPTNETTAKGLEYALADACVSRIAAVLGHEEDYEYFQQRSHSYLHYFDPDTGFMRGLSSDGKFREPFDPFYTAPAKGDYTEGNAWQYIWLVPHDVHGLIGLFESETAFTSKLDSLFVVEGYMGDEVAPDISGLIGQYVHGNEPSHHVIYLYNYVGQPWKAADRLREVLTTLYANTPDGLCGNEDVGQMSAWYVLSSIGLYQVEPAGGIYVIGSPLFDEVEIRVGKGKKFRIITYNNSTENRYICTARLNGQPYTKSYLRYEDLTQGGILELEMSDQPSDKFGVAPVDRP